MRRARNIFFFEKGIMKKTGNRRQKKGKNFKAERLNPGLTLLEILIALVIFSFASLYISRAITRILKQKKKTERVIKERRISANILEILQRDLKGAHLQFDMSLHFNRHTREELAEGKNERRRGDPRRRQNAPDPKFDSPGETNSAVFIPFTTGATKSLFFGEEDFITFTSLVSPAGGREARFVKVSYFIKSCEDRETGQTSACLVRGTSSHWKDRRDTENQRNHILLRGLKSLRFSYRDGERKEQVKSWNFQTRLRKGMSRAETKAVFLPAFVEADIEWEDKSRRLFRFPVSHPFLRAFRPGALSPLLYLNVSGTADSQTPPPRSSDTRKREGTSSDLPTFGPASSGPEGERAKVPGVGGDASASSGPVRERADH